MADYVAVAAFTTACSYLFWRNKARKKATDSVEDLPPSLIRRTTFLVSDIEASLKIYRDILGLEVVFDKILPIGGKGLPTGVFDTQGRLIFLLSHMDHRVGVLGLLTYLDKPIPKRPDGPRQVMQVGDAVLLLNTKNVEERMRRLKDIDGINIQSEGTVDTYPTTGGKTVTVHGNSFFDPDGHFIELNEVCDGEV